MRKGDRKIYNLQTVAPGKAFFFFIGQIIHGHSDGAALISRLMDRHTHTHTETKRSTHPADTDARLANHFSPIQKVFFIRVVYLSLFVLFTYNFWIPDKCRPQLKR